MFFRDRFMFDKKKRMASNQLLASKSSEKCSVESFIPTCQDKTQSWSQNCLFRCDKQNFDSTWSEICIENSIHVSNPFHSGLFWFSSRRQQTLSKIVNQTSWTSDHSSKCHKSVTYPYKLQQHCLHVAQVHYVKLTTGRGLIKVLDHKSGSSF